MGVIYSPPILKNIKISKTQSGKDFLAMFDVTWRIVIGNMR